MSLRNRVVELRWARTFVAPLGSPKVKEADAIGAQVDKELPSIQFQKFTRRRKWQIFANG
jgi:hypothetical protein